MEKNSQNITEKENREIDKSMTTTTTSSKDDKSGSNKSGSDSVPKKVKLYSSSIVKRKPFTSRDSFEIETKHVVLSFMKNVPKDVERRTWTPVSSTPSSETGGNLAKNQKILKKCHHIHKGFTRNKDTLNSEERPTKVTSDIDQSRLDSGSSSTQSYYRGDSCGFDQRLEFVAKGPPEGIRNIGDREEVKSPTNGHSFDDTTDFPGSLSSPRYGRTISSGSSTGDGSIVNDADDELGSSSSHSSIKLEINEAPVNQDNFGIDDENGIQIDALSQESSISENDTKNLLQVSHLEVMGNVDADKECSGRQKHSSNTQTIVPMNNDLPSSLDDFQDEDLLVFSDSPKPERTALRLDLDVCHHLQHLPNITDSLSAVLVQNSTELEYEVNNAVVHGQITQSEQTRVSSLASPETQVAQYLVSLADRLEAQYGQQLQAAVENAFHFEANTIPYEQFQTAFSDAMGQSLTGMTQVALCLVYSQRLTFAMLQSGQKKVNYLLEYAAQLVADKAADFIINQGGWSSLAETDIESSSLNQSRGSGDSSRVPSPTKQDRQREAIPEESTGNSKTTLPQNETSSEELSDYPQEQITEQRSQYISFLTPFFQRASYLGFRFSIVAAVTVLGIAIVLSKH